MYNGIFVPETIKEKAKEENKMLSLGIKIREHAMNTELKEKGYKKRWIHLSAKNIVFGPV
jgi:hypothetical protein